MSLNWKKEGTSLVNLVKNNSFLYNLPDAIGTSVEAKKATANITFEKMDAGTMSSTIITCNEGYRGNKSQVILSFRDPTGKSANAILKFQGATPAGQSDVSQNITLIDNNGTSKTIVLNVDRAITESTTDPIIIGMGGDIASDTALKRLQKFIEIIKCLLGFIALSVPKKPSFLL